MVEPNQERGMEDYRLDEVEAPARHPSAVRRLIGRRRSTVDYRAASCPAAGSIPDASGRHAGAGCDAGE